MSAGLGVFLIMLAAEAIKVVIADDHRLVRAGLRRLAVALATAGVIAAAHERQGP